ncbi:hypothetical protein A5717_10330 [Mycolicibacterium porcinum]|nr:hypothetical protein A5717_10330 [Mycolicibacterium porcinum]
MGQEFLIEIPMCVGDYAVPTVAGVGDLLHPHWGATDDWDAAVVVDAAVATEHGIGPLCPQVLPAADAIGDQNVEVGSPVGVDFCEFLPLAPLNLIAETVGNQCLQNAACTSFA